MHTIFELEPTMFCLVTQFNSFWCIQGLHGCRATVGRGDERQNLPNRLLCQKETIHAVRFFNSAPLCRRFVRRPVRTELSTQTTLRVSCPHRTGPETLRFALGVPLLVMATVGNGLAFAVMRRRSMRETSPGVYFAAIACADTSTVSETGRCCQQTRSKIRCLEREQVCAQQKCTQGCVVKFEVTRMCEHFAG